MKAYIKDNFANLIEFRAWSNSLTHIKTNRVLKTLFDDANIEKEIQKGTFGKNVNLAQ